MVDVGIRFDELENMKNQWDDGLTIREKRRPIQLELN